MITFAKFRNKDIKDFWRYFQYNILKCYRYKFHYLVLDLDYEKIQSTFHIPDLIIHELSYTDFHKGDPSVFNPEKMAIYKKRFEDESYVAYGVFHNEKLIYSTWISFEKLGLPVFSDYKLKSNEALLEDSYCHPSYRKQGLHRTMNHFRLIKIVEFGKSKAIAIVLDGNFPAYKVQIKSGFKDFGHFYTGKIFGIPFVTLNKNIYDIR